MEKAVLRKLTKFCVICGLVGIALLGVMKFHDGKREWKHFQIEYRELLLKKISRDRNPAFFERVVVMKPEIKQVVIEPWNAVDRCVSCHLGIDNPLFVDARLPFRAHPRPELLKYHPVEKYGCTICHGGQALATTYQGAAHKTIAHWQDPMVEKGLMQSRCGLCHKDFAAIGADKLVKGREIYKEMHCAGCHVINHQGGAVGPELSAFADKDPGAFAYTALKGNHSKQNWVIEHFKSPQNISSGSPMHLPTLNEYQIECLASYVLSLSQRDFPRQYIAKVTADFVPPKIDVIVPEAELMTSDDQ